MLASLSSVLFATAAFGQVLPIGPLVGDVLRPVDRLVSGTLAPLPNPRKQLPASAAPGAVLPPTTVEKVLDPVLGGVTKPVVTPVLRAVDPVLRAAEPIVGGIAAPALVDPVLRALEPVTGGVKQVEGIVISVVNVGGVTMLPGAAGALLPPLPNAGGVLRPVGEVVESATDPVRPTARKLADARLDRIAALVRANPGVVVLDRQGFPARAGELVVTDPDATVLAAATGRGFAVVARDDALGIAYVRLSTPRGLSLARAEKLLRKLGAQDVSADQLYAASGAAGMGSGPVAGTGVRIGMIDGGVAGNGTVQRGFAAGAPRASAHGTAVASLIAGSGRVKGVAPGARILAADVYGSDPAGGNATAIAKALAWLVGERVPVVTISLVGPPNPLLGKVVAAAQARGTIVVAAVGNDGAAAPPSYPASWPGVIAVTATDARKRILIEAGRATHLDYAAPGADMIAADMKGGAMPVRGTSFAAPLVAAKLALAHPEQDAANRGAAIARVDGKAERLGARYGRGLVCGSCPTPPK